jgi:hypothetical protein
VTLISASLRSLIVERAGNRCEYCRLGQESQVATFPVDHVIPVSKGGLTEAGNLALACPRCNAGKWVHQQAMDVQSGQVALLFHPRKQRWHDHFRWSTTEPAILEPLTATARATVTLLDLNLEPHLTIRRLLMSLGKHPPE